MTTRDAETDQVNRWMYVQPGMQVSIRGETWIITSRESGLFGMRNARTGQETNGRPTLTKPVTILYPPDAGYFDEGLSASGGRAPAPAVPGIDRHELAVALVQVRLSGVVLAEQDEDEATWRVLPAATRKPTMMRAHLLLWHDIDASRLDAEDLDGEHDHEPGHVPHVPHVHAVQ